MDQPTQLDRIEAKLDQLLAALAEDDDAPAAFDLDGASSSQERDQSQPL